jgi:hypothetical protein
MPTFVVGSFAVAGLIAAAAPLVIHLLNRRRYRVVDWAAMELLLEAIARNRRILHLRDLLLLLLRTACILLFAFALAQPHFKTSDAAVEPGQPVHAVIVLDNSLSMGYQRLDGILLDEAKTQINEFLDRLPPGSRISVIPACGSSQAWSNDVYRTTEDAREALSRIEVVDRPAVFSAAIDLAAQACTLAPEVPTKRVVFVGDQQKLNWPVGGSDAAVKSLPDVQIVQIAPDELRSNAWVADFRLQDDIADVESPAVFVGVVRYAGLEPRPNVEVVLTIDNVRVAAQSIDLEPGQTRQVRFSQQISAAVEPGEPTFVAASLSLAPDQLPADDVRHLMVPVVAALPVLFIDNLGPSEDPRRNRYGETFHLRRLLAPVRSRDEAVRQLVHIRHFAAHQVERQHLEDCRLVVIAGVESPQALTTMLREYVEQGGQLVIAAGGGFDPAAWTSRGWLEGGGILPLPLKAEAVGRIPDDAASNLDPFFLSPDTMTDERFAVADASREDLDDLYRTPLFFKAVAAEAYPRVLDELLEADAARETAIRRHEADLAKAAEQKAEKIPDVQPIDSELRPHWLLWGHDRLGLDPEEPVDVIARRQQPQILAKYSNGLPFLVERRIGRGDVMFVSTGVLSGWNNLTRTNAVVLLDRLLRGMLVRTLPRRNFGTNERAVFAVAAADRRGEFSLERPGGTTEALFVDAVGPEQYAVTLRNLTQRGTYHLTAEKMVDTPRSVPSDSGPRPASPLRAPQADRLWQVDLAVNGLPDESDLTTIGEVELRQRLGDASVRWVARGEPIRLEGAAVQGQEIWWWLMVVALGGLLVELAILAVLAIQSPGQSATSQPAPLAPEAL